MAAGSEFQTSTTRRLGSSIQLHQVTKNGESKRSREQTTKPPNLPCLRFYSQRRMLLLCGILLFVTLLTAQVNLSDAYQMYRRQAEDHKACNGYMNQHVYEKFNRVCKDCYHLYKDPEVYQLCRWEQLVLWMRSRLMRSLYFGQPLQNCLNLSCANKTAKENSFDVKMLTLRFLYRPSKLLGGKIREWSEAEVFPEWNAEWCQRLQWLTGLIYQAISA